MHKNHCRFCASELSDVFADLGMSPLSNAYLSAEELERGEMFYPLKAYVCRSCFLVQLMEFESPEDIFSDYAYFSSYSDTFLRHAKEYVDGVIPRFGLASDSLVVELASNDGYLLKNFVAAGIPVLGIEPAKNVAAVAVEQGIPTITEFFGRSQAAKLSEMGRKADLVIGNNVLAHVPDINDFVGGIKGILKERGVATLEFPHLLKLIELNQFDTIYHEHFSYLSLSAVTRVFESHGMKIIDVAEIPTHGGSLRIYAKHRENERLHEEKSVSSLREREENARLLDPAIYRAFGNRVAGVKRKLLETLIGLKNDGAKIVGYGAAAKGNTLLNYCGIRTDFLEYVADRSPHKAGKFLPGTHIPIVEVERIHEDKPDYVLILAWNLREEVVEQNSFIRDWGGKFIVPIPEVEVFG